jgi:hypothetical protein
VCGESRKHGSAWGQGFLRDRLLYPAAAEILRRLQAQASQAPPAPAAPAVPTATVHPMVRRQAAPRSRRLAQG